jgi:GTP-binding protein
MIGSLKSIHLESTTRLRQWIVICILFVVAVVTTTPTSSSLDRIHVQAFQSPIILFGHRYSNSLFPLMNRINDPSSSLLLQMARKNFSSTGNKKRAKKNTKGKKNEMKSQKTRSKGEDKQSKKSSHEQQQHLPPWQVMSDKDVKKNIESEKQRRQSIRSGKIASSVTSSTIKTGDVTASSSLLTSTDRQLFNWKRFSTDNIAGMKFTGAYLGKQLPPKMGCPEVAFLGRSNVGKSSLLNRLVKRLSDGGGGDSEARNDSARVGKTPGATASVNVYSIQGKRSKNVPLMGFVDLPGFGYAKLSKDVKESVEMAAERYLGKRKELALGILLVDIRRIPSEDDRAVLAALYDMGVPILVVATKVDKLRSKATLSDALEEVQMGLGLPEGQPFQVSSVTGEGVKQLWSIIMEACEDKVCELKEGMEGKLNRDETEADEDDTILLDEDGNWIEEEEATAEGLEWVKNYAYYDDSKEITKGSTALRPGSIQKMKENEESQAAANKAMKLKSLKKASRRMERQGDV